MTLPPDKQVAFPKLIAVATRASGRRLEVDGVWKAYDSGSYVVQDVSFTLEPGEFITLLGPSGSGKTTTLLMVAGFETPTRGRILVDGRDVAWLSPARRNFGVVFQGYALFPHLSVLENVEFALRMRRVSRHQSHLRAMEMLEKVGLTEFAKRRPRELSGGQQQRVALARALVFEPDALLLDEPLGALDKGLRETLQLEIKEIQRRIGISILLVTHDQDEAMMMSDYIAVMRNGRIVQLGSPADLYQHPRTPFVAGFLGETNLISTTECGSDGRIVRLRLSDGSICNAAEPCESRKRTADGKALLSLRPERIHILAPMERAENTMTGILIEQIFLGRQIRYVLQTFGQRLIVSTPDLQSWTKIGVGEEMRLGWSRDDAQLLADIEDHASREIPVPHGERGKQI